MAKVILTKYQKLFFAFFFLTLFLLSALFSAHRALTGSSDFDVYYNASKQLLLKAPIYSIAGEAAYTLTSPFLYPPFFACLFSFFTLFPITTAAVIWNILNLFFLIGALFLAVKIVTQEQGRSERKSSGSLLWLSLLTLLIVFTAIDNFAMAQVNPMVVFFLMLMLECYLMKKETAAGVSLGFAILLKVMPAIFIIYFCLKRKWRLVGSALVSLLFFLWLLPSLALGFGKSFDYHRAWFKETIQTQAKPLQLGYYSSQLSPSHQNLQAVLFRLLIDWDFRENTGGPNGRRFIFHSPIRLTEKQASEFSMASALCLFAVFIYCLLKQSRIDSLHHFLMEISLTLVTMVLLSPKMRSHGFVYLVLPWMFLVHTIALAKNGREARSAKITFFFSAIFYLAQGVKYFKFLGAGCFSVLTLFVYFISHLINLKQKTDAKF